MLDFHLARFPLLNGYYSPSLGKNPINDFLAPSPLLVREEIQIHDQYDVTISRFVGLLGDDHILLILDFNGLGFTGYGRQLGEDDGRESLDLKFSDAGIFLAANEPIGQSLIVVITSSIDKRTPRRVLIVLYLDHGRIIPFNIGDPVRDANNREGSSLSFWTKPLGRV